MRPLLLSTVILLLIVSCSGRKNLERNLNSGNYDYTINEALDRLRNNKEAKRKQDFIAILADAFIKGEENDLADIKHLKVDGNPENYRIIYETYSNLNNRQIAIREVLPLQYQGKSLELRFKNYDLPIVDYKNKTSFYLYEKGLKMLNSNDKSVLREAYNTFKYVDNIYPNFKDVRRVMDDAYSRGTDYVLVNIKNDTFQIIPQRLESDLLNFDTYGLDEFWTVYHGQRNPQINYDYSLQLLLRRINISPERITQREYLRENDLVDGWEYKLDRNGNVMKYSLGNDIKVDKIIRARARVTEYEQLKSTQIIANVDYYNDSTNTIIKSYPIESEFIFRHIFATFKGDQRALSIEDRELVRNREVYFPSNEQMVFDTGEDLKLKFKNIVKSHRFR
ncbi:hypothetical protein SAMN03097699_1294 [Flavobacteriaceae bacterium MAR_2010_188]|nr:hypothetical protein SAMN03097699_1294 [Flavobacteriaceae bacterium MAR_2010_188]